MHMTSKRFIRTRRGLGGVDAPAQQSTEQSGSYRPGKVSGSYTPAPAPAPTPAPVYVAPSAVAPAPVVMQPFPVATTPTLGPPLSFMPNALVPGITGGYTAPPIILPGAIEERIVEVPADSGGANGANGAQVAKPESKTPNWLIPVAIAAGLIITGG